MKTWPWLALAAVAVSLLALPKPPVIDEESYLWIGAHLDPLRPYDWERSWQGSRSYAYAHPPLFLEWMAIGARLGPLGARLLNLPFAALLGAAVGLLAERTCHHPRLAAGVWLSSTTVVLGLQDSLMIDLPAVALGTAAVALYREALDRPGWAWMLGAGLVLGLGIETKYPVLAVALALALHGLQWGGAPLLWLGAAAVVVPVEAGLWLAYGELHPLAVWTGRGEIAAGPFGERLVGAMARLVLLPLPFVLVRTHLRAAAVGLGLAVLALAVVRPATLGLGEALAVLVCTAAGGMVLARAAAAAASPATRRRKGDRGDALLLGGQVLAVFAAVVFLHNYASARYLWPAAAPVAILLVRAAEDVPGGKLLAKGVAATAGVLAVILAIADWRFARASVEVADRALAAAMDAGHAEGAFAGEWAFRWRMEAAGWARSAETPEASVLVVAENASPGPLHREGYEPVRRVESSDTFPVRVVDVEENIGLYAETLGALPFGFGRGPLEGATVYERR